MNKYCISMVRMVLSPNGFGFIGLWGAFIFGSPQHAGSDEVTKERAYNGIYVAEAERGKSAGQGVG